MVRYDLTSYGVKEGQPRSFTVYNLEELGSMLVANMHLINFFNRRTETAGKLRFVLVRIESVDRAKVLFAALIREVFEESFDFATYRPNSKLMYIYYGSKLNWVENIRSKIKEVTRRIMHSSQIYNEKDKWGENLISGGGKINGV